MTALPTRPCKRCGKEIVDVEITKDDGAPGRQVLDAKAPVYVVAETFMQGVKATRQRTAFVTHFATCANASDFSKGKSGESLADENARLRSELQAARDRVAVLEARP